MFDIYIIYQHISYISIMIMIIRIRSIIMIIRRGMIIIMKELRYGCGKTLLRASSFVTTLTAGIESELLPLLIVIVFFVIAIVVILHTVMS